MNWYKRAAENGDVKAAYQLGCLFSDGEVTPIQINEALLWWNRAADIAFVEDPTVSDLVTPKGPTGNAGIHALFNLGVLYQQGKLVQVDQVKAFQYFIRAAQLGSADAQYQVARCYLNGTGIARDKNLGISYLRKAALQGKQLAIDLLAELR